MSSQQRKTSYESQIELAKSRDDAFDQLVEKLRAQYDDIRNEPVPQALSELVQALKALEKKNADKS